MAQVKLTAALLLEAARRLRKGESHFACNALIFAGRDASGIWNNGLEEQLSIYLRRDGIPTDGSWLRTKEEMDSFSFPSAEAREQKAQYLVRLAGDLYEEECRALQAAIDVALKPVAAWPWPPAEPADSEGGETD